MALQVATSPTAAGSGPVGKMIGMGKRCRSAQMRPLIKKSLSDLSVELIHHVWLLLVAWTGSWFKTEKRSEGSECDITAPAAVGRDGVKRVSIQSHYYTTVGEFYLYYWNGISQFVLWAWFTKAAIPSEGIPEPDSRSLFKEHRASRTLDGSISCISLHVEAGGGIEICLRWKRVLSELTLEPGPHPSWNIGPILCSTVPSGKCVISKLIHSVYVSKKPSSLMFSPDHPLSSLVFCFPFLSLILFLSETLSPHPCFIHSPFVRLWRSPLQGFI